MKSMLTKLLVLLAVAFIAGCGGSSAFTSSATNSTGSTSSPGAAVSAISLRTTKGTIKSDDIDSTTITATVVDANNAAMPGITVAFSASGGQLSAASAQTDTLGNATVTFLSGANNPSNRTATVTAAAAGTTPAQIPVNITGSTLAITSDRPSLIIGGADQANLTITAKDGGNNAVYNSAVTLSVAGTGATPGAASITPSAGTTNVSGQVAAVLKAASPGTVTVTASGLGYSATQDFAITSQAAAFFISSPANNPATLLTGQPLTVTVNAPAQGSVTFTTSLGTFNCGGQPKSLCTVSVNGGTASAVLTSSTGGTATVEVTDSANPNTFASLTVLISAPSSAAAQIDLQSNVSVVAPSIGSNQSQVTLTATVRTSAATGSSLVSGAPVAFTLSNTTGGGETISPVYGITDSTGKVTATFTSGSRSSDSTGVKVTANVYNASSTIIASATTSTVLHNSHYPTP